MLYNHNLMRDTVLELASSVLVSDTGQCKTLRQRCFGATTAEIPLELMITYTVVILNDWGYRR